MTILQLDSIEWHDLPVASLSVTDRGIELVVTPWIEATDDYSRYALHISGADRVELNLEGALSARDFENLEISGLDYALSPTGRISGSIGILPGAAGHWTIAFENAAWTLEAV
jgi:hypothetical protein